jgi:hypothetical protein
MILKRRNSLMNMQPKQKLKNAFNKTSSGLKKAWQGFNSNESGLAISGGALVSGLTGVYIAVSASSILAMPVATPFALLLGGYGIVSNAKRISAEKRGLREENAALKTENAKLKKAAPQP